MNNKKSITLPRKSAKNNLLFMCVVRYRFCTKPYLIENACIPPVKMEHLFLSFKRDF